MLTSVGNSFMQQTRQLWRPCVNPFMNGTSRDEPLNVLNVNKVAKINNNSYSNNNIISRGVEKGKIGEGGERKSNEGEVAQGGGEGVGRAGRVTH